MGYSNGVALNAGKAVAYTASANTSLYKFVVPTGMHFVLLGVLQRVSVLFNSTGASGIKVVKTPSGGNAATLKTCTTMATNAAVGTTKYDDVTTTSSLDASFDPGDTLDIQVATAASSAGSADIEILIGLNG